MSNLTGAIVAMLIGLAIALAIIGLTGCDFTNPPNPQPPPVEGFGMSAPEQPQPVPRPQVDRPALNSPASGEGVSMYVYNEHGQAVTHGPAVEIYWGGTTDYGMSTLDVTNVLIARMTWEQETASMASEQNARAMFHLMQARQELEGKITTTDDGLPILE